MNLPPFVVPVLIVLGGIAYIVYVIKGQSQRAEQRIEPSASETWPRLYVAMSKAGISGEAITWVAGLNARPFIRKSGDRLLISESMVAQLGDDELAAMVKHVWLVHPSAYWVQFARTPGPWLTLAGLVGQTLYQPAALLILAGLAGIAEAGLLEIVSAASGAPELLQPPAAPRPWTKTSPYFPLVRFLLIMTLLVGGSVFLALSLGR